MREYTYGFYYEYKDVPGSGENRKTPEEIKNSVALVAQAVSQKLDPPGEAAPTSSTKVIAAPDGNGGVLAVVTSQDEDAVVAAVEATLEELGFLGRQVARPSRGS